MAMKLIRSKLLIDGTGRDPIPNGAVLIEDDRIRAVGPVEALDFPQDIEEIDLSDQTVLPGLVDAHSHCVLRGERRTLSQQNTDPLPRMTLRAANNVRADLLSGVTTMRTLGDPHYIDVMLRDAINEGEVPGPRLLVSGPALRATHGPGHTLGPGIDGVDAVRHQVRENIFNGSDVIKIYATGWLTADPAAYQLHQFTRTTPYTRAEFCAIMDEAHRIGLRVTAHAHCGAGLRDCIECGIDSIEHAAMMEEEVIDLFLKHDTWLVGTHTVLFDPEVGLMAKKDFETVPAYRDSLLRVQETVLTMHTRAIAAGVKYSMGSDARHGYFSRDLEFVNKHLGMSPMDAIVAGTRSAATVLGLEGMVGTLEAGKVADVISVKGNPLEDLTLLRNVQMVMKAGRRYDQLAVRDLGDGHPTGDQPR
ncbi:MAG: amidohydrolase family protein [Ardenticatenaceae bacterium]|nr:amidohydrolase family protein [Ardenticatenaceae bacterium]HBY94374.1 Xaa-Pro dipeptidase [Chloroflexota bacterium]